MIHEGIKPDKATLACGLKASCSIGVRAEGDHIYHQIVEDGLELNPEVGTALIDMYAKQKFLMDSYCIFERLSDENIFLWSAIMTSYVEQGYGHEALDMFDKLQKETRLLDKSTLLCTLKACIMTKDLRKGQIVHIHLLKHGYASDEALGSTLISVYFSCNVLQDGHLVFDRLPNKNVVTWTALISGYMDSGCNTFVFQLFDEMLQNGVQLDRALCLQILKACMSSTSRAQGKLVHHHILKLGLCSDVVLGNALIDMYGKFCMLMEARNVFERLQTPNLISWSSLVAVHAEAGNLKNALESLQNMQKEGVHPNVVTYLCTIKACCKVGALVEGKCLHHVVSEAQLDDNEIIGSALIDMYSKCDLVDDACQVFGGLTHQDEVSWATMITSFVQNGHELSALELFERMQEKGVKPNKVTLLCILKACGNVGALHHGYSIHDQIVRSESCADLYLGNALVSMYARFGSFHDANEVFARLSNQDRVSWEAIISGFSLQGNSELVKEHFERMQKLGFCPQETTLVTLFAACSHDGNVQDGCSYFEHHTRDAGKMFAKAEHYNCLVDLFGRVGHLTPAREMLQSMPAYPDLIGWVTLLSACKSHGNVGLGKECFEQTTQRTSDFAAGYTLMSDIYADAGMWEDVYGMLEQRKSMGAWKKPGRACIELNNNLHMFTVGDFESSNEERLNTCLEKINKVMRIEGYIPKT